MALFTLSISNQSPALANKSQEVQRINQFAHRALQAVVAAGGAQTSGNIMDDGGATVVGSWTFTSQN